jgi:hypothetical protein
MDARVHVAKVVNPIAHQVFSRDHNRAKLSYPIPQVCTAAPAAQRTYLRTTALHGMAPRQHTRAPYARLPLRLKRHGFSGAIAFKQSLAASNTASVKTMAV